MMASMSRRTIGQRPAAPAPMAMQRIAGEGKTG